MRRAGFVFLAVLASLLFACDRRDELPVTGGIPFDAPDRPAVELKQLTQLDANKLTHITVDQIGNVYWVQENDAGENVMFVIGESAVPRATALTSGNILREMGSLGGDGIIQDIRAAEGSIWFYFTGGKGRQSRTCLGQFSPRTGQIRIVADQARLAELSDMGTSLDLARGSLVGTGDHMWLWLRHSDISTFLRFEPRAAREAGPLLDITRPFTDVIADGRKLSMTREDLVVSSGAGGKLLVADMDNGLLWEVTEYGEASLRLTLVGLPKFLTPALAVQEKLYFFSGDADPIGDPLAVLNATHLPKVNYPAMLRVTGEQFAAIPRDDLRAPGGFPVYALRFQRLVRESKETLVAYDPASGALMRLTLPSEW